MEKGASQRASKVIYDRAGSTIATVEPADFDWDRIFAGADWFHFTGITPALGGKLPQICLEACEAAEAKGLILSCDLNFRKKLWTSEEANRCMSRLMPYVDVCIANEEDAKDVFGIEAEGTDINSGKLNRDGYISVARQLTERFGFQKVAITLRGSISANDNDWSGMLYCDGNAFFSPTYRVHIVDRVGGRNSFGGGLIHSLYVCMSQKSGQPQMFVFGGHIFTVKHIHVRTRSHRSVSALRRKLYFAPLFFLSNSKHISQGLIGKYFRKYGVTSENGVTPFSFMDKV